MTIRPRMFACVATSLLLASPCDAALLGHWKFDDPGNLGLDTAGGDNNGAGGADATYAAGGYIGGALALDATGTGLQVANSAMFQPLTTFTIAAFVNADLDGAGFGGGGTAGRIFSSLSPEAPNPPTAGNNGYGFGVLKDGGLRYTTYGIKDYNQPATTPDGAWAHAAVVVTEGSAEFFLNGASIGTIADANPAATVYPFHIGAGAVSGTDNFQGLIDDLQVYDEALSASAIAALAAVPEPASLALAALAAIGACGATGIRRKR